MNNRTVTNSSKHQSLQLNAICSIAIFALGATACAEVEPRDERIPEAASVEQQGDAAQAEQSLNGTVTFTDDTTCGGINSAARTRIRNAFTTARSWGASQNMTLCLAYHGMSMTNGDSPEVVQQKVLENMPTRVSCAVLANNASAEAGVGVSPEEITFDINYISSPNTKDWHISAVVLHEVAHNKGYTHANGAPDDMGIEESYTAAVGRMGFCAEAIGQNELTQTGLYSLYSPRNRTEYSALELNRGARLNIVGHEGGGPNEIRCPGGQFASGLRGRSGSWLDAVGLACRAADGVTDGAGASILGGSGGGSFDDRCPSGRLLVGIQGSGSDRVSSLGGICQAVTAIAARSNTDVSYMTVRGAAVSPSFNRRCPLGQVVKRIHVQTGERVDGIEVECQTISNAVVQGTYSFAVRGSTTDKAYIEQCPFGSVLTSLTGSAGGELDRLAGVCTQVNDLGDTVALTGDEGIPIQGQGGYGGVGFYTKCPAGMALTGAVLRYGYRVDGIQGVCSNVQQWSAASGTVQTSTLDHKGGGGGGTANLSCPREYFLTGWKIWTGENGGVTSVFGIAPKCVKADE